MNACPNHVWNHTSGCVCVANGSISAEVLDIDLMATTSATASTWRDWWPSPTGTEPIDASSWASAASEQAWVDAYNATPKEQRRPLELIHGSPKSALELTGHTHFGDRCTAMDRLYNTMDSVEDGYIHTYRWRGDLNPMLMPDTVANLVVHPHSPFGDAFYDTLAGEVAEMCDTDPDDFVEDAESSFAEHPDAAVRYENNTEGNGDGGLVSLAVASSSPDLEYVGSRQVTEEDFEYIAY